MTKPSKDFSTRLTSAKRFRDAARPFIEEVLLFCCPGREHDFNKTLKSTTEYEADGYVSLPEEMATDLAGDIITYYTPPETKWMEFVADVPEEILEAMGDEIEKIVTAREEEIQRLFTASNYYDIAPQWAFEICHGTPALWIQKAHLQQPVYFEVVQPHQLYLTPGYLGILDRFREMAVPAQSLKALFADWEVNLSDQKIVEKMRKPDAMCMVVWGFWLDWTDPGNPQWLSEITVDGVLITQERMVLGPIAAVPLQVGRFNPQPGKPWGRGPGWKALLDMRVLNKVNEIVLGAMDQAISNTLIYPDDGFLDLSEGVEAGRSYPARSGFDRNSIFELNKSVNVDQGWYSEQEFQNRIRTAFYQDGPRQRGETPPTASQWLDERRRVQQRLGKPSAPLWTELIYPMIQRVEYLGVQAGMLESEITANRRVINIKPISPLQKAQNQDQVMVAKSNLEMAFGILREQTANVLDPIQTLKNIVKASGDELTVVRDEQVMQDAAAAPAQ